MFINPTPYSRTGLTNVSETTWHHEYFSPVRCSHQNRNAGRLTWRLSNPVSIKDMASIRPYARQTTMLVQVVVPTAAVS